MLQIVGERKRVLTLETRKASSHLMYVHTQTQTIHTRTLSSISISSTLCVCVCVCVCVKEREMDRPTPCTAVFPNLSEFGEGPSESTY